MIFQVEYIPHEVVYDEFVGAYFITYNATRPGYLSIEIEVRGEQPQGSPFVTVINGGDITAQTICAAGIGTQVNTHIDFSSAITTETYCAQDGTTTGFCARCGKRHPLTNSLSWICRKQHL